MAWKGKLIWVCSLAVWSSSAAQHETLPQDCSSQAHQLSAVLKVVSECTETLPWSTEETAAMMFTLRNLSERLNKQLLRGCQGAEPKECPEPQVPDNGGLACVTVARKRYCKPLCNYGYDFGFLRRSLPFNECSEQKQYKWNSQYIGGNTLAVCNEALLQVSGTKTAYFPKHQDCLTTKMSSQLQDSIIGNLTSDLKSQGILEKPEYACLICGRT